MDNGMDNFVTLGRVAAHYGVKGWVKLRSYTRPAEEIFAFDRWTVRAAGAGLSAETLTLRDCRGHGRQLRAVFAGLCRREDTAHLIGALVGVEAEQLPALPQGRYYWRDLMGLRVVNADGLALGVLDAMMETGANDVAVVRRPGTKQEILIPWIEQVVSKVDVKSGEIAVDWALDS